MAQLKPWMPKNWGEHTRAWLDQAIREARVSAGELLIDAPLTPRDADNHPTLPWDLKLKVRDGVLAFAPDWPAAEAMSAELHFHDGGLDIELRGLFDQPLASLAVGDEVGDRDDLEAMFAGEGRDLGPDPRYRRFEPRRREALSPATAALMTYILEGVVERGTATSIASSGLSAFATSAATISTDVNDMVERSFQEPAKPKQ